MKRHNPRDSVYTLNAEELRRRYDLAGGNKTKEEPDQSSSFDISSGNAISIDEDGKINVMTTDIAVANNNLPITSHGVYTLMGGMEEYLKGI